MIKNSFLILFSFIVSVFYSQNGRISGTILDSKTGETLPGATVLIEGTTRGASADFDGKFSINNVPVGKVTLVVNYISYNSKKITDVVVKANDATDVNIQLDPSTSQDLQEVEVVVTLNKENNTALVLQQKNNTSISDGISAETIKRTPDKNTADVLKRVSGVTIQEDKFVIVRGLNERYNASYLNGSPLPSTEPDKKAFAFDLFPSNMLDGIVVNKTATPDMPGEFAGGIVQINTKSIPEKNFISVTGGGAYNSVTTGKTKIIYDGGKYDKFGFDDGSRNIPKEIPSFEEKASWISTPEQARMATYFKNDWAYSQSKFKPNSTFQFATGYNLKLKERDFLGVIFSLGYNSTQNLYTLNRIEYDPSPGIAGITNTTVIEKEQIYDNTIYQQQTSTGALLNLSCKLNTNNSLGLKNMASGSADNRFINTMIYLPISASDIITRTNSRFFTANKIISSQLSGDHFIPAAKIKINWIGGLNTIERSVPNLRFTSYSKYTHLLDTGDPTVPPNPKDTVYKATVADATTGPDYAGYRVFSKLDETIKSIKLDVSRLFKITENFKIDFKIGGLLQSRVRQFNIRQFGLNNFSLPGMGITSAKDSLTFLNENVIFSSQNMSVTPDGKGGFRLSEITKYDDNYHAESFLRAQYAMAEFKYTEKLKVIGGVRYESYFQEVRYKDRFQDSILVSSTINDLLPSASVIYNINDKFGIRLAYSKTLNRAEFRELANTNWFDPETRLSIAGNPSLTRCYIENYDLRFEYYPGRGQLVTVSGFKKWFDKPIERYMLGGSESQIYYRNANFAHIYGAEFEYRINLGAILKKDSIKFLNNLTLFSNLALMKSEANVKGFNSNVPDTRPMQGQSPYIINTGLSYIDNDNGFSVSAMLNRIGERIWLVGNELYSNRWEKPRTLFDMQFTKSFLKNRLELRFTIKDILQQNYIIYYNGNTSTSNAYNPNTDYINYKRNYGTTYSFALSYRF